MLCSTENVFHPPVFDSILRKHSGQIVGAAIFPPLKTETLPSKIKKCFMFDGWRALPRLFSHWVTHQKNCRFYSPPHFFKVEDVFNHYRITVDHFNNPNSEKCIERVRSLQVDIIFNNQPRILKEGILAAPRICGLNKHTSKLPAYRGIEPVFHALLDGCGTIGVSIHSMTPEIDAGEVFAQAVVPASKSVFDCYTRTFRLVPELFTKALDNLVKGTPLCSVDAEGTPYYREPGREEIARFRKMGLWYL